MTYPYRAIIWAAALTLTGVVFSSLAMLNRYILHFGQLASVIAVLASIAFVAAGWITLLAAAYHYVRARSWQQT